MRDINNSRKVVSLTYRCRKKSSYFLLNDSSFSNLSIDDPCNFITLPKTFFEFPAGFAVTKGSPLKAVLNSQ